MAVIQIPDELALQIEEGAQRAGESRDAFLREAVLLRLEDLKDCEPEFTDLQIAHLTEGVAQLRRGEKISSEDVDVWFAQLFQKLDAR